jgi:hypothetical protein
VGNKAPRTRRPGNRPTLPTRWQQCRAPLRGRRVRGHDGSQQRAALGAPSGFRPYQAARLARAGAAAFARHGDRQRGLTAIMFLAFLVGGGRQHDGATLTLWRVWPRWSAPVSTIATVVGMLEILHARWHQGAVVPAIITAGFSYIGMVLRALSGWTGLPPDRYSLAMYRPAALPAPVGGYSRPSAPKPTAEAAPSRSWPATTDPNSLPSTAICCSNPPECAANAWS